MAPLTRSLVCLQAACLLGRRAILSGSVASSARERSQYVATACLLPSRNIWSWIRPATLQQRFEDQSLPINSTLSSPSYSSVSSLQNNRPEANNRLFSQINLEVHGHDESVLESYSQFVRRAAKILNIDISGRIALPTKKQRFTLLKSPHIYKKHRVRYEIRTHRRLLQLHQLTGETADVFLEYIQRNLPEGISMNIEQVQLEELDVEMPVAAQTYFDNK